MNEEKRMRRRETVLFDDIGVAPEDKLSPETAGVLEALLTEPGMAATIADKLASLPRVELGVVMERLLDRARKEHEWGVPPILEACLVVADADEGQAKRLTAFLRERPVEQIQPDVVPRIASTPWAKEVFDVWLGNGLKGPAKKAIEVVG